MSRFDKIRKLVGKLRRRPEPPSPPPKLYLVTKEDFALLKMVHIHLAQGQRISIWGLNTKEDQYSHAVYLYKFWEMTPYEVLEKTGFWIGTKGVQNE